MLEECLSTAAKLYTTLPIQNPCANSMTVAFSAKSVILLAGH